jgi:hypothetical protein
VHRTQPGVRLPDIAASLGITERSAHGIVTDLAEAGYMLKLEDGRRNRYQIPGTPPLPEPTGRPGRGYLSLMGRGGKIRMRCPRT